MECNPSLTWLAQATMGRQAIEICVGRGGSAGASQFEAGFARGETGRARGEDGKGEGV